MKNFISHKLFAVLVLIFSIFNFAFLNCAYADPAGRVARLSNMSGAITFSPAGVKQWAYAKINRPFTTGDRLWADKKSRAEFQLGAATVRIGENTSLTIVNLDNKTAQFQLTQGTLNFRVKKIKSGQVYEVDAPNLAFSITQPGNYRLDVAADGNTTSVSVREGQGQANGKNSNFLIDAPQTCRFTGNDLSNHQCYTLAAPDDFDQWCLSRDKLSENSTSSQYVSDEVIGHEDLDQHGTWRNAGNYGNVWTPNNVPEGWVPYHYGHWAWIDPWGWTWIDDQPWGFAPFHYGRWVYFDGVWSWVPGPTIIEPVYAPALVVFIGAAINLALGGIGWFPLAPNEVYIPPYYVSHGYFYNINNSNTIINNTVINNIYNNPNTHLLYKNKLLPHAVMAVPMNAFVKSLPVNKAAITLSKNLIAKAPTSHTATVAPQKESLLGGGKAPEKLPPTQAFTRSVIAKTKPPATAIPFSEQQSLLAKNPGKPLEPKMLQSLSKTITIVHPTITVVKPYSRPILLKSAAPKPPTAKPLTPSVPHPPGLIHPTAPTEPFPKHKPIELISPEKRHPGPGHEPRPQLPPERKKIFPGGERPQMHQQQRPRCVGPFCNQLIHPQKREQERLLLPSRSGRALMPMPSTAPCGGPGHPCRPERR